MKMNFYWSMGSRQQLVFYWSGSSQVLHNHRQKKKQSLQTLVMNTLTASRNSSSPHRNLKQEAQRAWL